jgi:hypothetical protein
VQAVVGRSLPDAQRIEWQVTQQTDRQGYQQQVGLATFRPDGRQQEQVPVAILKPAERPRGVVLWVSEQGKSDLWRQSGRLRRPARRLLEAGYCVISPDLMGQGETAGKTGTPDAARRVNNPREFAGYTLGYNHSLFAQRTHDVLTTWALAEKVVPGAPVAIVGRQGGGRWVAAARAVADRPHHIAVVDTAGFRFADVGRWDHPDFLPGGAKYGDVAGMLAVAAPGLLWAANLTADQQQTVQAAYERLDEGDNLASTDGDPVEWVLENFARGT